MSCESANEKECKYMCFKEGGVWTCQQEARDYVSYLLDVSETESRLRIAGWPLDWKRMDC
eukprot:scaffold173937_cov38-Prasinocladus_malaysianus.AAC.1